MVAEQYRIGQAAEMLNVRVETIRRWERSGRIHTTRTAGGHRRIAADDLAKVAAERAEQSLARRSVVGGGVHAVVTSVSEDDAIAIVEIVAGPHRIVALTTREAVDALSLEPGTAISASNGARRG